MKTVVILINLVCFWSSIIAAKPSAVIEHHKRHLFVHKGGKLTIIDVTRIRILDEDGYRHAVFSDYYNSFKKIKSLRITVYDSNNKKVKRVGKPDAIDLMFNPGYEISDARTLVLDPRYRNFPFTVEIEVESKYNGFVGFPVWMPRHTAHLEVRSAEMILDCFQDFEFRSKELNGMNTPEITATNERKTVRWTAKDLQAVEEHISYNSFVSAQPAVHLAPIKFEYGKTNGSLSDWPDFGQWYHTLNEGRNSLSLSTKHFLDSLRQLYPNDGEILSREVYKFMQRKTRYISIQLGIGGHQAIPSDVVERTGYGDCKALTNYMGAMLHYVGISANHVLVYAGDDVPDILHDFPSNQFNHVLLAVPLKSDTLWFECTSQTAPPGYIGTFTDDRYVLWIDNNKSKLIRSPIFGPEESMMTRNCVVKVNPNGNAELNLMIKQSGMFYDEAHYYTNLSSDKIERLNHAKFDYKDFSLLSFNIVFPDPEASVLGLNYILQVNNLGKQVGTKIVMPSNILPTVEKSIQLDMINNKAEVRRSFTVIDSVKVTLPGDHRLVRIPESTTESSEFGTFEIRFTQVKNSILIYRSCMFRKGNYKDKSFKRFYEVVEKLRAIERQTIVLESRT